MHISTVHREYTAHKRCLLTCFFFALLLKNVANISNAFFNETNLFQSSMENIIIQSS